MCHHRLRCTADCKKGKIIDVKFRDTKYNVTYESKLDKPEFDFAVLVNELLLLRLKFLQVQFKIPRAVLLSEQRLSVRR